MTIASKTTIPSGTLKPFVDTLEDTPQRQARILARRRQTPSRKYIKEAPMECLEETAIAALYRGRRYEDVPRGAPEAQYSGGPLTEEEIVRRCGYAGLALARGSRPGLWCIGKHRDVPLRQMIKIANSYLRQGGYTPLPDPDSTIGATGVASSSRMLADFQRLGINS